MRSWVSGTQGKSGLSVRSKCLRGTRERGRGSTQVSEDARGNIACTTRHAGINPQLHSRDLAPAALHLCVSFFECVSPLLSPSLPYQGLIALNTDLGRAVSWFVCSSRVLRGTRERGGERTSVSEDARDNIAECA
jgi:hypothetical protein